jgi:hypothetical protein
MHEFPLLICAPGQRIAALEQAVLGFAALTAPRCG